MRGALCVKPTSGKFEKYWFVLKDATLAWYVLETEKDTKEKDKEKKKKDKAKDTVRVLYLFFFLPFFSPIFVRGFFWFTNGLVFLRDFVFTTFVGRKTRRISSAHIRHTRGRRSEQKR